MAETQNKTIEERLAALEARVEKVEKRMSLPRAPKKVQIAAASGRSSVESRLRAHIKSGDWLARLGIMLLLVGLALLFKWGVDRGWLTPLIRIVFGVFMGSSLLGLGIWLAPVRRTIGQVLLGGSIATYFVTIYAAYQFYDMLPYTLAFAAMVLVSVIAFGLSVQQKGVVLAMIATLGGLGTPFFLYSGEGSISGLVLYTCLVLTLVGSIYLYHGWRLLLWTAALGGLVVALLAWFPETIRNEALVDRRAVQSGLLFGLVAFGIVPVLRDRWSFRNPARWPVPPIRRLPLIVDRPAFLLCAGVPLVVWVMSQHLWSISGRYSALIAAVGAVCYAAAYAFLRHKQWLRLAAAHGVATTLLLAFAWLSLAEKTWHWYLLFALQGAALQYWHIDCGM